MKTLALLTLLVSGAAWADSGPCTAQDYSNPQKAPRWECPGPDEGVVTPRLQFRPSLGLEAGTSIIKKDAKRPFVTEYDAVLLDKTKVLELGLRIKGLRRLRWLERHKANDLLAVEKKYVGDRLQAKLDLEISRKKVAVSQRNQALRDLASAKKWYRSWSFGLVVGIVTTSAAAIALGYAAR
jgi:hypothetical protein